MLSPASIATLARYNQWQNQSLVTAADGLNAAERQADRGSFFGSIQGTLSHQLWGDQIWLWRFADWPKPDGGIGESADLFPKWSTFKQARAAFDSRFIDWADAVDADWLGGMLSWYSGAAKKQLEQPRWFLLAHLFNHQTHHRGQVHAMLTAAGAKPDDTDLLLMEPISLDAKR
ncbi:MAG: DinB family protein [Pseudomonadota bacterium]